MHASDGDGAKADAERRRKLRRIKSELISFALSMSGVLLRMLVVYGLPVGAVGGLHFMGKLSQQSLVAAIVGAVLWMFVASALTRDWENWGDRWFYGRRQ